MKPVNNLLSWYFSKRSLPYWCLIIADSVIVFVSTLFTYWLFNRSQSLFDHRQGVFYMALLMVAISWFGSKVFKSYLGVVRFSSFVDLMKVAYANGLSMVIALLLSWLFEGWHIYSLTSMHQTGIVLTFCVATLLMWALRILVKNLYDVTQDHGAAMRTFIYGALSGGVGIAKNINSQRPKRFKLCGFISHDDRAKHMTLMGQNVYNLNDDLSTILTKNRIKALIVSPLRLEDFRSRQELQDMLIKLGIKIYITHQAQEAHIENGELTDADYGSMQMQEVSVEDLLPRSVINVDMESVGAMLTGKRVLITGSAGSIGSEMVRQIAIYKPASMMLIDQAETPEHDIRLMMSKQFADIEAKTVVTSICRADRMEQIFKVFKPDYVFHAAAYKHVPMMEDNPSEAVQNNILGTKILADLSVKYGVKKFVMVSTDKAVNPTNVMGCSKRICEIYVQSLNNTQKTCQFVTTRFGNVLGSNGSVIPLFQEQIKNGGPVTVTDERIVRFFMLIPEACKLVLEAGTKGKGGEIFVFDMGNPVKIIDLARRMIALSGAKNVEIKITGLREGEKLYEEVLNELEGTKPSFHEKIRIAEVRQYDYKVVSKQIDDLIEISHKYDNMATVAKMKEIVPEYKSNNSVYEMLDK